MSDLTHSPSEDIETFEEAAGASYESMLITTDSFEEFSHELSVSLEEDVLITAAKVKSNIDEIQSNSIETDNTEGFEKDEQGSAASAPVLSPNKDSGLLPTKAAKLAAGGDFGSQDLLDQQIEYVDDGANADDYLHDHKWLNEREHVFVISSAGKPIYSLHGNEDKLATLCGVMQALVSVVHANQDTIMSIHAIGMKFVFLVKGPLILVAASRRPLSVQQIQLQLT